MKLPMQPIHRDAHGVIRFKENALVRHLLDWALDNHGYGMNQLARVEASDEDRMQFAQLIGYSVSGASDLDYFSDDVIFEAFAIADKLNPERSQP